MLKKQNISTDKQKLYGHLEKFVINKYNEYLEDYTSIGDDDIVLCYVFPNGITCSMEQDALFFETNNENYIDFHLNMQNIKFNNTSGIEIDYSYLADDEYTRIDEHLYWSDLHLDPKISKSVEYCLLVPYEKWKFESEISPQIGSLPKNVQKI